VNLLKQAMIEQGWNVKKELILKENLLN